MIESFPSCLIFWSLSSSSSESYLFIRAWVSDSLLPMLDLHLIACCHLTRRRYSVWIYMIRNFAMFKCPVLARLDLLVLTGDEEHEALAGWGRDLLLAGRHVTGLEVLCCLRGEPLLGETDWSLDSVTSSMSAWQRWWQLSWQNPVSCSPVWSAGPARLSSPPHSTGNTSPPRTACRRPGGTSARAASPSDPARSSWAPSSCPSSAWRCPQLWGARSLSAMPRGWRPLLSAV